MADKKVIALELTLDSNKGQESVKSFKQRLKEANAELFTMAEKFGETSTEAANAAKKVALLKDTMGDAKALAETFNPDKKFVALGGAIQGVTAGFSAFTGAMGVLGDESKETEKLLLKVQSAMALQQGISGIIGSVDAFRLLGNTIKTQVVSAFSTLKSAIITTGIGALVVAIGAVVYAFNEMADAAENAAEAEKQLAEETEKFASISLKSEEGFAKRKRDLALANAKTEEEKFKIEQQYRSDLYNAKSRFYNELKNQDSEAAIAILDQQKEIANEAAIAKIEEQKRLGKISEDAAKEARKKLEEANKKAAEKRKEDEKKEIEDTKAFLKEKLKAGDDAFEQETIQYDNAALLRTDDLNARTAYNQMWMDAEYETEVAYSDMLRAQAEARKTIAQKEKEQRIQLAQDTANALGALSEVIGKETIAGKALAVAQALINTYQGISKGVSMGMPWGIPSIVAASATGFKAVRDIIAVKVPGKSSGSSAPNLSTTIAPLQPQARNTTLDQASINSIGNAANRAFVVESDITNNQEKIRRINRLARIN
jgi:hypothetical protein